MTEPLIPSFSTRLRIDEPSFVAWIEGSGAAAIEALLTQSFDAAVLDMQHGHFDAAAAMAGIASCALVHKPALVRIPVGEFATAARMLDAGAAAVIAPMIDTSADARAFADVVKYPPIGMRSWGPGRATWLSGASGSDYLGAANAQQLAIAMIETSAGLDAVDAILDEPGIDGVFVGPSDLSISLSGGERVDPRMPLVDAALTRIAASAARAGKIAGLFCFDGTTAKAMAQRGFRLISVSTDLLLMSQAARRELDAAR